MTSSERKAIKVLGENHSELLVLAARLLRVRSIQLEHPGPEPKPRPGRSPRPGPGLEPEPEPEPEPNQVGSLGDEAAQVARALPVGRGYVCEDADDIPRTFAHIFRRASTLDLLWLYVVLALSRYFLPYGCTSHLAQARQDRRRRRELLTNQRHQQQYGVRCIGTVYGVLVRCTVGCMAQEAQSFCLCVTFLSTRFYIYSRTALAAVGAPTCYNAAACAGRFAVVLGCCATGRLAFTRTEL